MAQIHNGTLWVPLCIYASLTKTPLENVRQHILVCDNKAHYVRLAKLLLSHSGSESRHHACIHLGAERATMRAQAKCVLEWFDNISTPVPSWYRNEMSGTVL